MGYEQARKDLQGFIGSNYSATLIAWDNVDFTVPSDGSSWIRVGVKNVGSSFKSLGPAKVTRRTGIIFIQVFIPDGKTTKQADSITDTLVNLFETKLLQGFRFESPDVKEIGNNNGWFQVNIAVSYHFDDLTTYGS